CAGLFFAQNSVYIRLRDLHVAGFTTRIKAYRELNAAFPERLLCERYLSFSPLKMAGFFTSFEGCHGTLR
ncbi:hypothetical protein OLZ33_23125, partial [Pantoea ananatis]|uniref:hypothetical protein n=1 Tax=Pantoea ananas TaxID=553 RepID=UPI002223AF95